MSPDTRSAKSLHGREEIEAIGSGLSGANKNGIPADLRESGLWIDRKVMGYDREQLRAVLRRSCAERLRTVEIRGCVD